MSHLCQRLNTRQSPPSPLLLRPCRYSQMFCDSTCQYLSVRLTHNCCWQGEEIFQLLKAALKRGVNVQIAVADDNQFSDIETRILAALGWSISSIGSPIASYLWYGNRTLEYTATLHSCCSQWSPRLCGNQTLPSTLRSRAPAVSEKTLSFFLSGALIGSVSIDWRLFLGAEVRKLDMERLVGGGILHTKFIISDMHSFYSGSANMDWRALTQVCRVYLS